MSRLNPALQACLGAGEIELADDAITTFLNPSSYLKLRRSTVLQEFDQVGIDGIALVLVLRAIGRRLTRQSFDFTSIAGPVFSWAEDQNRPLALVGGTQAQVAETARLLTSRWPRLNLVLMASGYFEESDARQQVIFEVAKHADALVIAGLGAVLQERFLIDCRRAGWLGPGFTCGAFISQTAEGGISYYPRLIDRLNLRWVYRIYREPKLAARYLLQYPWFILVFVSDLIRIRLRVRLHYG